MAKPNIPDLLETANKNRRWNKSLIKSMNQKNNELLNLRERIKNQRMKIKELEQKVKDLQKDQINSGGD